MHTILSEQEKIHYLREKDLIEKYKKNEKYLLKKKNSMYYMKQNYPKNLLISIFPSLLNNALLLNKMEQISNLI